MRHRAALLSLLLCAVASAATAQVMTADSQGKMTPVQALDQLRDGNARFLANKPRTHDWPKTVAATSSGQFPFAAVLSCMDSRVPPEIVFDQGIGDLFSVRVAGNVVDEDDLGSLEYAAKSGVKLIVVLGHTRCGAVHGAIDNVELGNLTALLGKIKPSVVAAHCSDTPARSASPRSRRRTCASPCATSAPAAPTSRPPWTQARSSWSAPCTTW